MPIYLAEVKTLDQLLPSRGPNTYSAGTHDSDKGFVKYGPKSSDEPSLIITDPIFDDERNVISPGFYELSLSKDRINLILYQSEKIIAIIPVFKIEEDKTQAQLSQPIDKKSQRKFDKEQKKQEKKKKKLIKEKKMLTEPEIYNKADIEYDIKGDYYLIKYESGKIRAWGALKLKY